MSEQTEIVQLYEDLGDALAVGVLGSELGVASGDELVDQIMAFIARTPAANPAGSGALRSLGARAASVLRSIATSPASILALGASVSVYAWMTADESVAVESIASVERTTLATLKACAGDQECLRRMAAANAEAQRRVGDAASGGTSLGTVLLLGGGVLAFMWWMGRR